MALQEVHDITVRMRGATTETLEAVRELLGGDPGVLITHHTRTVEVDS